MKTIKILTLLLSLSFASAALADGGILPQYAADKTDTMKKLAIPLATDKCAYSPGEVVTFTATGTLPAGLKVRYRHLGDIVGKAKVTENTWTWTAPSTDFMGYLAELYTTIDGVDYIYGTIAVDVSSDWSRFPRYGFVASYGGDKTSHRTKKEMTWLNRCHINGVQFQDWHQYHDWPLGGTRDNLLTTYTDIANRTIYTRSVKCYIDAQHNFGMKSIFYNLCFGALDGYADRGVKEEWFAFKDQNHNNKDYHDLPDSWKSDIYVVNPANTEWQAHLAQRNDDVYASLDFDGYQIDQLGWRGQIFDYYGNEINLPSGYNSFIKAMKKAHPSKRLIMNAVGDYGAEEIANTHDVDFFYNEVWGNHDYNSYTDTEATFAGLKNLLDNNRRFDSEKQTVFAAYMDYLRDNWYFNTAGVVMADAVMFALGGSHLELGGDHMLCREYFPYSGVKWHDEIEDWMTHYYDFHTAYENLLRGNWTEAEGIGGRCSKVTINKWAPKNNQITIVPRMVEDKLVVHLLNFTKSSEMATISDDNYMLCWHDNKGERPWPQEFQNLSIQVTGVQKVGRVWVASPDYAGGAVQEITNYTYSGTTLRLTLPSIQFWTMIVIEPEKLVIPGDANSDGSVTMSDANAVVNYYVAGGIGEIDIKAADLNNDDYIAMSDANAIVNIFISE